jgi:hypothetical protein
MQEFRNEGMEVRRCKFLKELWKYIILTSSPVYQFFIVVGPWEYRIPGNRGKLLINEGRSLKLILFV